MTTDITNSLEIAAGKAFKELSRYSLKDLNKHFEDNYNPVVIIGMEDNFSVSIELQPEDEDETGYDYSLYICINKGNIIIYKMLLNNIVYQYHKHILEYIDADEVAHWIKRTVVHFKKLIEIQAVCDSAEPIKKSNYLRQSYVELYEKVGDYKDCPVCLEKINKDNICIPNCGHLICSGCIVKLTSCPCCRENY